MKRKGVTLIAGAAVLGILTGSYFLLKSYNVQQEEIALEEASGEEILRMDTENLTKISFLIGGEERVFQKQDDLWKLEADETFPVDETSLLSAVSPLNPLLAVRILENVENSSEFGMETPQNKITLENQDGEITVLTIGDTNEGTGNDYLMLGEDETKIYTVEDTLRASFSNDLYDYAVSEELPTLMASDITGVTITEGESGYKLYLEDAQWMTADLSGEGQKADSDAVNDAMSSLGSLTYADYLEHNCTDGAEYGLDEPSAVLTISYQVEAETDAEGETDSEPASEADETTEMESTAEDDEITEIKAVSENETESETETEIAMIEKTLQLAVGSMDASGDYYVQLEGSTEVHTIDGTILENFLGKTLADWEAAEEMETES